MQVGQGRIFRLGDFAKVRDCALSVSLWGQEECERWKEGRREGDKRATEMREELEMGIDAMDRARETTQRGGAMRVVERREEGRGGGGGGASSDDGSGGLLKLTSPPRRPTSGVDKGGEERSKEVEVDNT